MSGRVCDGCGKYLWNFMNETGRLAASCHVGDVSQAGRRGTWLALTRTSFSLSAPPRVCYSLSSPVQILEEPAYFYPDLQLYSGRNEVSTLTVEASGGLRGKNGKSVAVGLLGA